MAKIKKQYDLFYDEAFHDRKITENDKNRGELNIENNEQAENFLTASIGFRSFQTEKYFQEFTQFEQRAKNLLGLTDEKEFKGTTISKNNFKNGVGSFNKNALKIYSDYFDLFDMNTIIQISSLNKFELVIINLLETVSLPPYVNTQNFVYSIIKFLNHYKNKRIISILFDDSATSEKILGSIVSLFDEVLAHIDGVPRKENEMQAIQQMRFIIESSILNVKASKKYEWDYSRAINGIELLLEELKIKKTSTTLYIDFEENTIKEAKTRGFKKVEGVISDECIGVRISDILCNFIGRILKAIEDEYLEDWDNANTRVTIDERRILSEDWFKINEEQFLLYKKIANIFYSRKDIYWTIQTGLYAGHTSVFFALIYYIGLEFQTYQEYTLESLITHRETFNARSLEREGSIFH